MFIFDILRDAMELIYGRRVTESGEPETWWPDDMDCGWLLEEKWEAEGEEYQRLLREAAKEMRDGDE